MTGRAPAPYRWKTQPTVAPAVRVRDERIPDTPIDLLDAYRDPAQRAIACAFWRIGYAAALDRAPESTAWKADR